MANVKSGGRKTAKNNGVRELAPGEKLESVIKAEERLVVDFSAIWCAPCKAFAPILKRFAEEHPGIAVLKVNIDEFEELADKHRIQAVPTVIGFVGGENILKFEGLRRYNDLCKELEGMML